MTYAALQILAAAVAFLPSRLRSALGASLAFVARAVLRVRRGVVATAMTRAGIPDPSGSLASMYDRLGRGLVELLWLAGAKPADREATVAAVVIDEDASLALDEAVARGPVVIFGSHTGNWELAAAAAAKRLAPRGKKLVVVAKAMNARGVDRFTARLRAALGVVTVSPRGALEAVRRSLAAGDVVVMPIDQVPDRAAHATIVPFLGAAALVDRAPATLAWRARATILVVAAQRDGALHRVRLLASVPPPGAEEKRETRHEGDARLWIDETSRLATSRLEAFVRANPADWLWLHRRWRAPRARSRPGERQAAAVPACGDAAGGLLR